MKVVFMDVDGVFNSREWWKTMDEAERERRYEANDHFNPEAVKRFSEVIERTGAKIVVSSSWRNLFKWDDLMEIFPRNGLCLEYVGKTPTKFSYRPRGAEIEEWLVDHMEKLGVTSIAIVDDEADMIHMSPWLVKTSYETGFLAEHATALEEMLSKPFTKDDLDNAWKGYEEDHY